MYAKSQQNVNWYYALNVLDPLACRRKRIDTRL